MLQDKQTERGPPPLTFVPQAFLRIRKSQHSISSTRSNPISPHRHYLSSSLDHENSLHLTSITQPNLAIPFPLQTLDLARHSISPLRLRLSPSLDDGTRFRHFFLLNTRRLLDRSALHFAGSFTASPSPPYHSTATRPLRASSSSSFTRLRRSFSPFQLRILSHRLSFHSTTSHFASTSSPEFLAIVRASVISVHSTLSLIHI